MKRLKLSGIFLMILITFWSNKEIVQANTPVFDRVFLQKTVKKYENPEILNSPVLRLIFCGGKVFAYGEFGLAHFNGENWVESNPDDDDSTGKVSSPRNLYCRNGSIRTAEFTAGPPPGTTIEFGRPDSNGTIWLETNNGPAIIRDGKFEFLPVGNPAGGPLSGDVRDIYITDEDAVYMATAMGVSVYSENNGWSAISGDQGLPFEDTTSVVFRDGILLVGTSIGGARYADGEWEYFQSGRYLPDDHVLAVELDHEGSAWFGTGKGVSRIGYAGMTLKEKSDYYLKTLHERHNRLDFIGDSPLEVPGDITTIFQKTHDNENVWTGMYLAMECYRYATTGEDDAIESARRSLASMLRLETITGIPGYFGRSYARKGEELWQKGGEWHDTPDGEWVWKGDTSSDEVVGRFYGFSVFYDICAGEGEKELIRKSLSRTMHYIIDNDYFLVDVDGEPTRWGKWNPKWLKTEGKFQKNLNALEILSHLKTAYSMTGEEKFQEEYVRLIREQGYAKFAKKAKIYQPKMINHSDDLLAFLSWYPLLKYEKNKHLLENYFLPGIRRSWKFVKKEKNPNWNFIYGAVTPEGEDYDPDGAAWTLRRMPLDLIYWEVKNSHRVDIEFDPHEGMRPGEKQSLNVLPPDERFMLKFNENPFKLDGYWKGNNAEAPTFWLLPYWLGRYYGFIEPPAGDSAENDSK